MKRKASDFKPADVQVEYCGMSAPRYQRCAFCGRHYDASEGPHRPHAVCLVCYPIVRAIEKKAMEEG